MPIQPTTQFITILGVSFPEIDISTTPIHDIIFGATPTGDLKIYDYDLLPSPDWRTPTAQEELDNIPNYVDKNEKEFTVKSSDTTNPFIRDYRLLKREVIKIESVSLSYYEGVDINKPLNSDTITYNTGYYIFPDTDYLIRLK